MVEKRKPTRDVIYKKLLDGILRGKINTGEKLGEAELAHQFHVSRTPVREAFLQLEREGFISHTKHVGAIVRKVSAKRVQETYELIALLESYALEISVNKLGKKDIAHLKDLQLLMEANVKSRKFSNYVKLNAEFHNFLVKKSNNETLREHIQSLRRSIYRFVAIGQTLPLHIDEYLLAHHRIIEEIANGDGSNAASLMKSHLHDAQRYLLEVMTDLKTLKF
ncbi:MAG: GntR family transcriptional regulator [Pseudomonadota bacterium]